MTEQEYLRKIRSESRVMIEDDEGIPTSVPVSLAEAFRAHFAELKRRREAGEPLLTPEDQAQLDRMRSHRDEFIKQAEALLKGGNNQCQQNRSGC